MFAIMSLDMLRTKREKLIKKIAQKYDLELLLLFGSKVSGRTHQESDFDIAYLSRKELSGKEMIDLNCDLMDVFESDRIDTVDLKKASPLLGYEISKNCQLLFGKELEFLEFKAVAFKKYIDAGPLFKLQDVLIKKKHRLLKETIYGK